jgi:Ni2+-binding GTPase involved in maturation of urease and hydrogenase
MTEEPHLHLLGGFLGSGKTTAIIQASKLLMARGQRVGVVTNDQGRYLVDTAFFRLQDLPTVEVGGGCFCCRYGDLEEQLGILKKKAQPDVIFAESVGSCAVLVATVIKPLLELKGSPMHPRSFSVLTDARLLRMRLLDVLLPFSEEVMTIFDQQIEEASLLVISKMDLLNPSQLDQVRELTGQRWPGKAVHFLNSWARKSVQGWLDILQKPGLAAPEALLEMDYQRYGAGEACLAWLDEDVHIGGLEGRGSWVAQRILSEMLIALQLRGAPIGHLKFFLQGADGGQGKISFNTLPTLDWEAMLPVLLGPTLHLTINARVEMPALELRDLVQSALERGVQLPGIHILSQSLDAFHPSAPQPTHRLR